MEEQVKSYLGKLTDNAAAVIQWLGPGATIANEFDAFPDLTVPGDLACLWSLFNGVKAPQGTTLEYLWLDGQFFFYSIAETVDDHAITVDQQATDPHFSEYWPEGFVPIGSPGDGSRLLVDCHAGSPTFGSVFELFHGDGTARLSKSLADYFKMLDTFFDRGIIQVLDNGEVEVDFEAYRREGKLLNPDCDGFA